MRLHNVYGPEPRQGTLLYNLINNETCTIYNAGRNVRHFTYIGDVAEGLLFALSCDRQLVNIRNPVSNTVREFCEEVAKYRPLKLDYTDELRPLDNFAQSVDEGIYSVPLHYRDIGHGLAQVFKV